MSSVTLWKCDRCDHEYAIADVPRDGERWWSVSKWRVGVGPANITGARREDRELDLCKVCRTSFLAWWKGKR